MDRKELESLVIKQQKVLFELHKQQMETSKLDADTVLLAPFRFLNDTIREFHLAAQESNRRAQIYCEESACEMADKLGIEYSDGKDALERVNELVDKIRDY